MARIESSTSRHSVSGRGGSTMFRQGVMTPPRSRAAGNCADGCSSAPAAASPARHAASTPASRYPRPIFPPCRLRLADPFLVVLAPLQTGGPPLGVQLEPHQVPVLDERPLPDGPE